MDQQRTVGQLGVFVEERLKPPGVRGKRARGRPDLDGQQAVRGLDDEVHLVPGRGAPVKDLRATRLHVPLGEEVAEHQVLQVRSRHARVSRSLIVPLPYRFLPRL